MSDTPLNYHLMHPGGDSLPADPNAAFCVDGVYHLHYVLSHPWNEGVSYSFIHVTSPDMLNWSWQRTTLQRAFAGHGMFSGTGFITREGVPAVIYHGQGLDRNQIAIAKDRELCEWQESYTVDVTNADGSEIQDCHHWDPDCFLIGDTYYAVFGGEQQPLFKSKDLKRWTLIGDFLHHELPDVMIGEDISCPNFFKLDGRWVLLCISHRLGCRYYIGDWDAQAEQFVPEMHGRMNWRRDEQPVCGVLERTDFFAPESLLTPDGRRVMWAWLASVGKDGALLNKSIQSLPRELSIPADGVLRIRPLRELESQRYDPVVSNDVVIANPLTDYFDVIPPTVPAALQSLASLEGEALELRIVIPREEAERKLFGFVFFADGASGGLPLLLRPETGTIRLGSTESPLAVADLPEGEDLELRIFIDGYLVEVFANDRQALLAAHMDGYGENYLSAFTVGTETLIKTLEIWKIRPANQGFLDAQDNDLWKPAES